MPRDWYGMMWRGLRKPPRVILARLADEAIGELERFRAPRRARRFGHDSLLRKLAAPDINRLWERVGRQAYVAHVKPVEAGELDRFCPNERARILAAADRSLEHNIDLLGSGAVELGERIDWQRDYKTGMRWPHAYFRSIDYNNPDRPSDVKFPWEVSRLQWTIPVGQAYLLTGDERYSEGVKRILEQWIDDNPYAGSVNWACTMEVALRILSWTWLFHVFNRSRAWCDSSFRFQFLRALYLHADFTERHLERSDVNGNHFTANAAGLVFAGLFFCDGMDSRRWLRVGWEILVDELPKQVFADGVNYEASAAYHRLVFELFLLPALYRERAGLSVPEWYKERLLAMARFTDAYSQVDGSAPLWGDADDGRALPLGGQPINDHRYLIGVVAAAWSSTTMRERFAGPRDEIFWLLGPTAAQWLPDVPVPEAEPTSTDFPEGGCFIMRDRCNHVFIDCGPVGLAGRGGHGHNDCLSFEAVLGGVKLITDCGAYVYTASYKERNHFRSTSCHNTPQVDGEELNRFVRPDYLWNLHDDARPQPIAWRAGPGHDVFIGSHAGYVRLAPPAQVLREIVLDHLLCRMMIFDRIAHASGRRVEIPLHLWPGLNVADTGSNFVWVGSRGQGATIAWNDDGAWHLRIGETRVSPSYGRVWDAIRLSWHCTGETDPELMVCLATDHIDPQEVLRWGEKISREMTR